MTATPERTDGFNVFELFDFNVPYEIRLNHALEEEMLAPFHYYGVADLTYDDGRTTTDETELRVLISPERVDHLLNALETYGRPASHRGADLLQSPRGGHRTLGSPQRPIAARSPAAHGRAHRRGLRSPSRGAGRGARAWRPRLHPHRRRLQRGCRHPDGQPGRDAAPDAVGDRLRAAARSRTAQGDGKDYSSSSTSSATTPTTSSSRSRSSATSRSTRSPYVRT